MNRLPGNLTDALAERHARAWLPAWHRLRSLVAASSGSGRAERQAEIAACCRTLAALADDWRGLDVSTYWVRDQADELLHLAAVSWGWLLAGALGSAASWSPAERRGLAAAAVVLGFTAGELAAVVEESEPS